MIVDIHMHLGNILYPNGGDIINSSIPFPNRFNIQRFEEDILENKSTRFSHWAFDLLDDVYTKSVRKRIFAGTYENFLNHKKIVAEYDKKIGGDGKMLFVCMPVSPYVTYKDLVEAAQKDKNLLPFTSPNPDIPIQDACELIESEIKTAYGIKLHPIIQRTQFDADLYVSAIETIRKKDKIVLFHAGASRYYLGKERILQKCEYDDISAAKRLVKLFPDVKFIMGHAGIAEYKEWASEFKNSDNVFVDGTVQSVKSLQELHSLYGSNRILYASDFPAIRTEPTLKIFFKAFKGELLEKCLYKNAITLLGNQIINTKEV
jgi:hypothetical protein